MRYVMHIFIFALMFSSCSYLPENSEIDLTPRIENADYIIYFSGIMTPENAFLMIPGGLVDAHVYECWIEKLIQKDSAIAVVLVKYPTNLAITNINKVMKVANELKEFKKWVIGGHSLGGVVAATVAYDNADFFDGLVLMASWSREAADLSDWDGAVLSLYASEDLLATGDKVFENKAYLPEGDSIYSMTELTGMKAHTEYYEIMGGNHSGFGCYGFQDGDGEATISQNEQQSQIVLLLDSFFNALW